MKKTVARKQPGSGPIGTAGISLSIVIVILMLMLMAGMLFAGNLQKRKKEKPWAKPNPVAIVLDQVERQSAIDERLRTEMGKASHTLDDPLVILDPYGVSPLTAIVMFKTEDPSRIALTVKGTDHSGDTGFNFRDYRTDHLLPVYGLYADTENELTVHATDRAGKSREKRLKIRTEKLPPSVDSIRMDILKVDRTDMQPGFTFFYEHSPKPAFDSSGAVRWFLDLPTLQSTLYDYHGRMIAASGTTLQGDTLLYEIDPLGRIYSIMSSPYGVHHDIEEAAGGRLLVTGSEAGATVEDIVYEIDPSTGENGPMLDMKKIIDQNRPSVYSTNRDWLHMNAIEWSAGDASIIVSGRHQSAVIKLAYPEGAIRWILGEHEGWLPEYTRYLLTPSGGRFEWPRAQHAPEILPDQDGNPDTVDILLFDNHIATGTQEKRFSRLVQYRIDEKAMTVEQIWEFGREYGNDLYAEARGVANQLSGGNILGYFCLTEGHRTAYSRVIELRKSETSPKIVFDAVMYDKNRESLADYRVARRELYSRADDDFSKLPPCRDYVSETVRANAREL